MKIKTQIQFKDYIKLQYVLNYQNYFILFSTVFVALAFSLQLQQFMEGSADSDAVFWLIFLGTYIFVRPIAIYFRAKKKFDTYQIMQGEITYEFLTDKMIITSLYSNSEIPWDKIYKVRELKSWFLIYQSSSLANLVDRKSVV